MPALAKAVATPGMSPARAIICCNSAQGCPIGRDCDEFSDLWCIKQIHSENPEKTYEECEYILFVDGKDATIN